VTGSVARGLADDASDVDVYLYVDEVDRDALGDATRLDGIASSRAFAVPTADGWFAKYVVGGRYLDVESVPVARLAAAATAADAGEPSPALHALAAGLRDAVALLGAEELARWQRRLVYGDRLALAEVGRLLPRLLSPTALYELTMRRGDVLSFQARLSDVLLATIGLLAAANRRFVPVADPKWLRWHVAGLQVQPEGFWERIDEGLQRPAPAAMAALDALVGEVLDIVHAAVPSAAVARGRFALALRPNP
jgi:predicted nucleotidyltransferase